MAVSVGTPQGSLLNLSWCPVLRAAIITPRLHMSDTAPMWRGSPGWQSSQRTRLLPRSAARVLNNYDDKLAVAKLGPNTIAAPHRRVGAWRTMTSEESPHRRRATQTPFESASWLVRWHLRTAGLRAACSRP